MAKVQRHIEELAKIFRVLGDPTRLRIWTALAEGEQNVTQLCNLLKAPQPTVSHHLGILRMNGLVVNRRHGKEIYYSRGEMEAGSTGKALQSLVSGPNAVRVGPIAFGLAGK